MTGFDAKAMLADRTRATDEGAILIMTRKAREMKARGEDIISLTIGEPDFDTPAHISQAAKDALDAGHTHYAPIPGIPALRTALTKKLNQENGIACGPENIVVTNGAKQAIANAVYSLIGPGDEVILLAPYWVAYESIITLAGGTCKVLQAGVEHDFKVSAEQLAAAISPKTRLVLLNTPSNPAGSVFSRSELEALAEVIKAHPRLMVLSDEIYEYITYGVPAVSIGSLAGMAERTVTINGFSKGFAMTGWRLGYGAAPEAVAKAMTMMQGALTAGANAFVQHAAVAALAGGRGDCHAMTKEYEARRDLVVARLDAMAGVKSNVPQGAFYIFPDVSAFLGRKSGNRVISTVDDLCQWILEDHKLASVPGSAFGNDKCLRLSFAASRKDITKGLDRLESALNMLANGSI